MGSPGWFAKRQPAGTPGSDVGSRGAAGERFVIVGLGNPGSEYAGNRHNVGFWAINRLTKEVGAELKNSKLAGVAEAVFEGRRLTLVKPRTYVNESGRAVGELLRRSGIPAGNLVVIYDELDLPPGQVRVRAKGSHGGHNGMRSIIGAIGTGDFPRIRVGIGRPALRGVPTWEPEIVASWVLGNPGAAQRVLLEEGVALAAEAALAVIRDGPERAMNRFNRNEKSPVERTKDAGNPERQARADP